jgi:uncharacterized membrane protein YbhN (UPF0104 family)
VLLTPDALRRIRIDEVGAALAGLDHAWLGVALLATLVNIAVLGLYDVVVFRGAPQTGFQRWQYGAVSFAWSSFLTLGPLAGPALRLWLYRPALDVICGLVRLSPGLLWYSA